MAVNLYRKQLPNIARCIFKRGLQREVIYDDPKCHEPTRKALVLGIYVDETNPMDNGVLTATAER